MAEESVTLTLEVKDRMTGPLKSADDAVTDLSDSLDETADASKPSRFGFKDLGKQMQTVNRMALAASGTMSKIGRGMSDATRNAVGLGKQGLASVKSFASGFTPVQKAVAGVRTGFQNVSRGVQTALKTASGHVRSFSGSMGTLGGKVRGAFNSAKSSASSFVSSMGSVGSRAVSNVVGGFRNLASRMSGVATKAADAFSSAMRKGLDAARKAAETAGGAILGALSVAAVGGAKRLIGLENAQAKLRGLGNSAEDVEGIMGDVNTSIEGTMFKLDDAATVAASAVASGIKPGQELQTMLKDVGNSAMATGVPLAEMGTIFNKVAATGKAQTESVNQLAERGLPIWTKLAESLGVTQDEVQEMVSSGKVGFKEFSDAARLAAGSVAEEMTNTMTGQAMNVPAYLSMIGGSLLAGIQPLVVPILKGVNMVLANLAESLAPFGEMMAGKMEPIAEKIGGVFEALAEGGMSEMGDKLAELAPVLGPVAGALLAMGTAAANSIPVIGRFLPVVNPVVGALVGLIATSPELQAALMDLVKTVGSLLIPVFQQVAPLIAGAFATVIPVVAGALAAIVSFIAENEWLLKTIGFVAAAVGAFALTIKVVRIALAAWAAVTRAWVAITKIAAVAMRAFNLVMRMNPIGLIITGIMLLIGAFVLMYNNVEWFRNAVDVVWNAIKAGAQFVVDWFTGTLMPAFQAVWDGITTGLSWAYNNIIQPIFTALQIAFLVVATLWTLYWQTIIKPVIDGFAAAAMWLWNNAITPALNGILWAWDMLVAGIQWAWTNLLLPTINAVGTAITWLKDNIWTPVVNAIQWAWNRVVLGIQFYWTNVLKPVIDAVGTAISWLKTNVWDPTLSGIRSAWEVMSDGISWVKTNIIDPVFDGIKTGVGYVADSFENAKDAIGKSWEKLKELTAAPVRFIVEDVYNEGIRKTWNGIAEAVKLDDLKMPEFKLNFADGGVFPQNAGGPRYATGGVLPGYTPGRDVHRFSSPTAGNLYLSGGESIMRPEFTRAIGGEQGVHRLNQLARSGRTDDVHNVVDHAFASGGVFPSGPVAGVNAFADSGVWRGLWAIVKDKFPQARMTSNYRPGSNTASGNRSHHSRGNAVDLAGPRSMDTKTMGSIFNYLRGNYANSSEIIYSPGEGRQIKNGRNYRYTGAVRSMHYNHVHWANTRVPKGAPDYDPGGDGGGGGVMDALFDLNPLKAFAKKFEGLGGGGWGEMLGAAGKNLISSLVEKISPFQFGDVIAKGGEAISKGAAWAKGQTWAAMKGITGADKSAMNWLVSKESSWNPKAQNPTTTASGLPQMINSTSRAYLGGAPAKNFGVFDQLNGMRQYVNDRYNGWLGAKAFHQRNDYYKDGGALPEMLGMPVGLYDYGGIIPGGDAVAVSRTRDPELVSTAAQARAQTELLRAAADRERERNNGGSDDMPTILVQIEGVDLSNHPALERAVKSGMESAFREARERA